MESKRGRSVKHAHDTDGSRLLAETLRLTASMVQQQDINVLLQQGLELCMQVLSCERALLISGKAHPHSIMRAVGEQNLQARFSTTAIRLVNEKDEPLLISDTISDEVLSAQESINRNDIRSVLCSKLDIGATGLGDDAVYLYLDSRTEVRPFTIDDLEKFKILSSLMASLVLKSELLARQEATIEELRSQVEERKFEDLIFASNRFEKCVKLIRQGAPTDVPILLIGETGTGKELLARSVHKKSKRKDGPFLAVNCGAIPSNLIESHLFGHEKGAFTGAISSRKGYFEEASGGTLFLDEIGELPVDMQSHFLRVLQEGEIIRVGSTKPISVDVRIVAATNVDLEQACAEGRFRKDLYYRLNVLPVAVPAVRDRGEDALLLARFFLRRYSEEFDNQGVVFSRDAEKAIMMHDWPGNVREIQNRVQRAVITAGSRSITREDLDLELEGKPAYTSLRQARETIDREMIAYAFEKAPNNLTNAAKILDIDRKSLRILLEKYGIVS